jgi:hypothetical protein
MILYYNPKNSALLKKINTMLAKTFGLLIIVAPDKKTYLLQDHHKFIRPEEKAKRIFIGNILATPPGMYYIYEEIKPAKKVAPRKVAKKVAPRKVAKEKFVASKLIIIKKKR